MKITVILVLMIYGLIMTAGIKAYKKQNKLMKDIANFNKELINERKNILEILTCADFMKENYFITVDKIKEELGIKEK